MVNKKIGELRISVVRRIGEIGVRGMSNVEIIN